MEEIKYIETRNINEVEEYLNDIFKDNNVRIIKIFSEFCTESQCGVISTDEEVIMLFDNGFALVIEYYDLSKICLTYKKLNKDEYNKICSYINRDYFNRVSEIYNLVNGNMVFSCRKLVIFEYDTIESIVVNGVVGEYENWENNDIVTKIADENTFGEIVFNLSNGNSIHIIADDAINDGYCLIWADGCERKEYR